MESAAPSVQPTESDSSTQIAAPARAKRPRRRRGLLNRDLILSKALEILERDGESGFSMRRIADALDTAPMSLYRHIRDKADLVEGVTRLALGQLATAPTVEGEWHDRVTAWLVNLRHEVRAHPAIVPLLRANGETLPALLQPAEVLVGILREAGFDQYRAAQISWELLWFGMGFVITEMRSTENTPEAVLNVVAARKDELPQLAQTLPALVDREPNDVFESGARHFVDGLRAELAASSR